MIESILELPDDILVEFFTRYVSNEDLRRLQSVCRRFYSILERYPIPWKKTLSRKTNVSFSCLKNAAGCPAIENVRHAPSTVSHPLYLPEEYRYDVLSDRSTDSARVISDDYRRPYDRLTRCSQLDCDIHRLMNNYRALSVLAPRWTESPLYVNSTLIKFIRRAQTSLLQYDEHHHHLWFTYDQTLSCLNLDTNSIDASYGFANDDILCYKVYNDHLICMANGNLLRIIARQTHNVHACPVDFQQQSQSMPVERNDILSLDVFSNDQDRYAILSGSRDHIVNMRTFDLSTETQRRVWSTRVDDRVLCSRFTPDGHYFLIGTGGTSSLYPLVLFNSEHARPIHLYNARYRLGAGVRCIEWVSPNVFVAAGFDNQFKEFDLRTGQCHYTYSDKYGNDYSSMVVSVDHDDVANNIILGCNHHSTVRWINRKQRKLSDVFFVAREASPVHSLAVTPEYLFASVDRSIVALDFTGANRRLGQVNRRV